MALLQFGDVMHGLDPLAGTQFGGGEKKDKKTKTKKSGNSLTHGKPISPMRDATSSTLTPQRSKKRDWTGLRMLIRFLGRYSLYVDDPILCKDPYNDSSLTKAQKKFSKGPVSDAEMNYIAARESKQGRTLDDAHAKIFAALCAIIALSESTAREALKFSRLDALLEASLGPHRSNPKMAEALSRARARMRDVREMDRLAELESKQTLYHRSITPAASHLPDLNGGSVAMGYSGASNAPSQATSPSQELQHLSREEEKMANSTASPTEIRELKKGYAYGRMGALDSRSLVSSTSNETKEESMGVILSDGVSPLLERPQTVPAKSSVSLHSEEDSSPPRPTQRPGDKVMVNGRHHVPESPVRRGLYSEQVRVSTDSALHNAFFKVLPSKPLYPDRLETEVITTQPDRVVDILQKSIAESRKQERKVMGKVVKKGYVLDSGPAMGTNTISILERARRTYNPKGRPLTAGETYRVKPAVSSSQAFGSNGGEAAKSRVKLAPIETERDAQTTPVETNTRPVTAPSTLRRKASHEELLAESVVNDAVAAGLDQRIVNAVGGSSSPVAAPVPEPVPAFGSAPTLSPIEAAAPSADPAQSLRVDGFDLDAQETFADGFADFTPGYAMMPPEKAPLPFEAGKAELVDTTDPNAKAFNEESMSMVMQSLDLLFPE